MSLYEGDETMEMIETEVIEETPKKKAKKNQSRKLQDIMDTYNNMQQGELENDSLSSKYTISGINDINELIADAVIKISEYTDNGSKKTILSKLTSKAVSVFDPKEVWLSKWVKSSAESSRKSELSDKTPDEIVKIIKNSLETKRKEVQDTILKLYKEKDNHIKRINSYEGLLEKSVDIYENSDKDTEENFSSQMLSTMIRGSIITLQSSIETVLNPLIAASKISAEHIATLLPTISLNLKGDLNAIAFQQGLSDLNNGAQVLVELSNAVSEKVTSSVQETTLQTLDILTNTGVNVDTIKNKIARDEKFKNELLLKIEQVRKSTEKEFNEIAKMSNQLAIQNKTNNQMFLENYSLNKHSSKMEN